MKSDQRMWLAYLFVAGYFGVIFAVVFIDKPLANGDLVKDWMIVLGPPVGAIVGALFRSDRVDEQRAQNTSDAFAAITATANSTTPPASVTLDPGQSATVAAAPPSEGA